MASHTKAARAATRVRGPVLDQPVAQGVEIIGHTDMDGRPDGLQMQYLEAGGRHFLYVGHFWSGGVTILDVTDPAHAVTAGFVPTPNRDTWHIKVQVADGIMMLPSELNFFALDVNPANVASGVRLLDLADPTDPARAVVRARRGDRVPPLVVERRRLRLRLGGRGGAGHLDARRAGHDAGDADHRPVGPGPPAQGVRVLAARAARRGHSHG